MIRLGNLEKQKLAAATGLAPIQIDKLLSMGVIDEKAALKVIVCHDYRSLRRRGLYKASQVKQVLSERYGVTLGFVSKCAAGEKVVKRYNCLKCGKNIDFRTKKRNRGKCDSCVAEDIKKEIMS